MREYKRNGTSTREEVKKLHKDHTVAEMMKILNRSEPQIRAILGSEGLKAKRKVRKEEFNKDAIIVKASQMLDKDSKCWTLANKVLKELNIVQSCDNVVKCRKILRGNFNFKETRGRNKYEDKEVSTLDDDMIMRCRKAMNVKTGDYVDFSKMRKVEKTEMDYYEMNKYSDLRNGRRY